jgi:hypothetical protein
MKPPKTQAAQLPLFPEYPEPPKPVPHEEGVARLREIRAAIENARLDEKPSAGNRG